MEDKIILRSVGVHSGKFHADDVVAVALLLYVNLVDEDKIYRSRDNEVLDNCEFVCDVGGVNNEESKRFDHHQNSYKGMHASAGLVLNFIEKSGHLDKEVCNKIRYKLVNAVDDHDNGRGVLNASTFSYIIEDWYFIRRGDREEDIAYHQFIEAVRFAKSFIGRIVNKFLYLKDAVVPEVEDAIKKSENHTMIFKNNVNWTEVFFDILPDNKDIYFALYKREGGDWCIKCVPKEKGSFKVLCPFPEKWSGLFGETLSKVSGIEGGIFCHKNLFISSWKNLQQAKDAINCALLNKKNIIN